MLEPFRAFVAEHGLFPEGARVLVGFSGGADSTCLLHMMKRAKVDCVAAHLHHGQRPEADRELARCAAFAESLGVPIVTGKADVPQMAQDLGIGLEEAGREARYRFFDEAARQTGCARIATAHTRSDLVETVLLNLVRGSGMAGLAGIPLERGSVVRPLLPFTRRQTEEYCREQGLEWITDPSNSDLRFARARLRLNVIPELQAMQPALEQTVARMARIVGEEDRFLDAAAAAALEKAEIPLNGPLRFLTLDAEAAFDRASLRHLPTVLLRRAVRLVAEALGGRLSHDQTVQIAQGVAGEGKGSATSEGGLVVTAWDEARLHAWAETEEPPFRRPLSLPGDLASEPHGWKLSVRVERPGGRPAARTALEAQLDPDGFRGPLYVRSVQPGDRLRPLGGVGDRKLSDLLGEAKLTSLARKRLPLLCDVQGPIWAPGVALADRVRLAPSATQALRVVFAPIRANTFLIETEADVRT
jgi:tRNA(Ile)-lysidine synthase